MNGRMNKERTIYSYNIRSTWQLRLYKSCTKGYIKAKTV